MRPTTVATGIRRRRMQGMPPSWAKSTEMRSKRVMTGILAEGTFRSRARTVKPARAVASMLGPCAAPGPCKRARVHSLLMTTRVQVAFNDDLARRLPLPLAQLYRRAHNAKSPLERHQA